MKHFSVKDYFDTLHNQILFSNFDTLRDYCRHDNKPRPSQTRPPHPKFNGEKPIEVGVDASVGKI